MNPHAWEALGWLVAAAVIIAGGTFYLRRGDDGLTDRQRARYAKQYADNEGKKPTAEEMRRYRELGRQQREDPTCLCTAAERAAKRCSVPCPPGWIR